MIPDQATSSRIPGAAATNPLICKCEVTGNHFGNRTSRFSQKGESESECSRFSNMRFNFNSLEGQTRLMTSWTELLLANDSRK